MVNLEIEELRRDRKMAVRILSIKLGSVKFVTPFRVLAHSGFGVSSESSLVKGIYPVIEVFSSIDLGKIASLRADYEARRKAVGKWFSLIRGAKSKGGAIFFGLRINGSNVDRSSAEFLADVIGGFNVDVVSVPTTLDVNVKSYIDFVEAFSEALKSTIYGEKAVLAYSIPPAILRSYDVLWKLLEYYRNKEPYILVIDFNGSNPFSTGLLPSVMRIFRWVKSIEKELGRSCLVYGINVSKGRGKWYPAPARDLASIFTGLDVLGSNHIPPKMRREIYDVLRIRGFEPKLLNIKDYGYFRLNEAVDYVPEGFEVKMSLEKVKENRELYRVFNVERQIIETKHIIKLIEEGQDLKEYVKNKRCLDKKAKETIFTISGHSSLSRFL